MAARLGKVLARCALGPLNYAGSLIMASRVPDALNELSPDNLYGGLTRGIDETAKLAGLARGDVEAALPRHELRAAAESLAASQAGAVAAWNVHAGRIGGLLAGVADLTVDGRAPDVPLCLERLANKVSRDKEFATPLRALAADVERWRALIDRCHDLLESGGAIAAAYRRRRQRTIALAVVGGVAVAAVAIVGIRVRTAHARVEDRLVAAQLAPCAVLELTDAELDGGSSGQRARAVALKTTCADQRRREAEAAADRDKREAAAKADRAERDARDAACSALADHVTASAVVDADIGAAGDGLPLMKRVARRELGPTDLGPAAPVFPCADVNGARNKIAAAWAEAVMKADWRSYDDLSDAAIHAIGQRALDLPLTQRVLYAKHADAVAKRAVLGGDIPGLARAAKLCALAAELGHAPGAFCPGAIKLAGAP